MGLDLTKTAGGKWLPAGRYIVKIVSKEMVTANSGSEGVKYEFMEIATGRKTKGSYWMYDSAGDPSKGAWRLRALSEAAKLDEASLRNFNAGMLVGRTVGIIVEQDEGTIYHSVQGEFAPDEKAAPRKQAEGAASESAEQDAQQQEPSEPPESDPIDDDDVPF